MGNGRRCDEELGLVEGGDKGAAPAKLLDRQRRREMELKTIVIRVRDSFSLGGNVFFLNK